MADQISGVGPSSSSSDALVDLMTATTPGTDDPSKTQEKAMTGSVSTEQSAPTDPSAVHLGTNAQVNPLLDAADQGGAGGATADAGTDIFVAGAAPDASASPALLEGTPPSQEVAAVSNEAPPLAFAAHEPAQTFATPEGALATASVETADNTTPANPSAEAGPSVQDELQVYPLDVSPTQAADPAAPSDPVPEAPVDAAPSDPVPEAPVDAAPSDPVPEAPVDAAPSDPAPGAPVDAAPSDPVPEAPVDAAPSDPAPEAPVAPTPPANAAPVITFEGGGDGAWPIVEENTTFVGRITATDTDANTTLSFAIVGGGDADRFTIDAQTGDLRFIGAPDYEAPTDADGDRLYQVQVAVSDGIATDTQLIDVRIADVNEAAVFTSGAAATFAENATGTVYTAAATDPDAGTTLSYSLSGTDAALFNIDAQTGAVSFKAAPNYEVPADQGGNNVYDVTVSASDGVNSTAQAVAITVTNVNEAAVFTSGAAATFAENATGTVYTAVASDPEGAPLSYSLSGTDAALFNIDSATGAVSFKAAPNYEAPADQGGNNVYDVTVSASDGVNSTAQAVAITVTNVNEAAVFTSGAAATFAENATGTVYTAAATDPDAGAPLSYSLSGTDAALFNIDSATGAVSFKAAPNYEAPADQGGNNVYDVTVSASDGVNTTAQAVAITVTNVNEAAVFTSGAAATFAENATGTVYTAAATDPDAGAPLSYSLSGTDAALFNIDSATGAVSFKAAPNYEAPADQGGNNVYDVTVSASDGVNTTAQAVAITVTNVNEAAVFTSGAAATFAENATGTVYTAAATDPDAGTTLSYSLSGTDAALFNIDSATGAVSFKAAPNYEAPADQGGNNVYDVTVSASDGVNTTAQAVAITVTNVNEAAVFTSGAAATFAENATGTVYTAAATDPDAGTTLSYSLSGTDAALFNIDSATGAVSFKAAPNYEAPADQGGNNVYDVTVSASDGVNSTAQAVAITVTNVNEAAVFTSGAAATFAENATGTVYTAAATDPDAGTTLSYSLSGTDAALFNIDSATGAVSFKAAPNYEAPADQGGNNVYDVTVSASDGVNTTSRAVAISVTDVAEQVQLGSGNDTYVESGVTELSVDGGSGNDTITGGTGNDTLRGGDGNDTIFGGAGADSITGGAGDDRLDGGNEATNTINFSGDRIFYDFFYNGNGTFSHNDQRVSGPTDGNDTISNFSIFNYGSTTWAPTYGTLGNSNAETTTFSTTSYPHFAQGGNDVLIGSSGNDSIYGEAGDDTLTGNAGDDFLDGGIGNDTIDGGIGNDQLRGGAGNDRITGGAGNDIIFAGSGSDTAVFSGNWRDYTITQGADAGGEYFILADKVSGRDGTDKVYGVETFQFADRTIAVSQAGDLLNDAPTGAAWQSGGTLSENSANGTVVGTVAAVDQDAGDAFTYTLTDSANGRFAINAATGQIIVADGSQLNYESQTGHTISVQVTDAAGATATQTLTIAVADVAETIQLGSGNDTYVESGVTELSVDGGAGNDTITGGAGNDVLSGGLGTDSLNGAGGDDTFQFQQDFAWQNTVALERDTGASITINGFNGSYDTFIGGSGVDTLNGTSGNDYISANNGSTNLIQGIEIINAGAGNDVIDLSPLSFIWTDSVTVNGGSGNDVIWTDAGNDTLYGDSGNDTLNGAAGNDTLYGDNAQNLIVNGSFEDLGAASDNVTVDWGVRTGDLTGWTRSTPEAFEAHNATYGGVSGGDGNYWLDLDASPGNAVVSQTVSGLVGGEKLELSVDMANRSGGATGHAEVYWNGQLVGTLDNNSTAAKTYNFDVTAGSGDGTDTLTFRGTGAADSVGASIDNVKLVYAGDDTLDGGAGNDTLFGDAGNDTLIGGAGNDQLWGGNGSDLFVFAATDGNDAVHGGAGLGWTDTIDLHGAGAPAGNWTVHLDDGGSFTSNAASGAFDLGHDKSGNITFADGHTIGFDTLERITWG